jgi:hypothetical protein
VKGKKVAVGFAAYETGSVKGSMSKKYSKRRRWLLCCRFGFRVGWFPGNGIT